MSASLAGESLHDERSFFFQLSATGYEEFLGTAFDPTLHRRRSLNLPNEPTVTVIVADSAIHLDPSTIRIVDATSALDHWIRRMATVAAQLKNFASLAGAWIVVNRKPVPT